MDGCIGWNRRERDKPRVYEGDGGETARVCPRRVGGRVLPAESRRHVNASAIRIPSSFSFLLTTFVLSVFREISWNAARRRGDSVEIVLVQSRPGKM